MFEASKESTTSSSNDPGQLLLQLLQSSFESSRYGAKSVLAGLILFLGGSVILFITFCFIRPRHNLIYAPKLKYNLEKSRNGYSTMPDMKTPPPLTKQPFHWVKLVFQITEDELIERLGIDAALFIRFHKMLRNMFFVLSVLVCCVGIPINIYYNLRSPYAQNLSTSDAFILMTPSLVRGRPLIAHVAMGWIVDITVLYFLWTNFKRVIEMRRHEFATTDYQRALFMRTLLVTEIPKRLGSEEGLRELMSSFDSSPSIVDHHSSSPNYTSSSNEPISSITPIIDQVDLGRDVRKLAELHEDYKNSTLALESYLAKYLKNPERLPSKRPQCRPIKEDRSNLPRNVDAIDYYMTRLKILKQKIDYASIDIERSDILPYGFVSYRSQPECHTVAKRAYKKGRISGALVRFAPRPEDIIWKNIFLGRYERATKQWWGNFLFVAMMIAWIVPNAFIGCFLADLSRLGVLWHGFQNYMDGHQVIFAVLQGVLSPIVTSLIFLILPMIMRRMSQWQGKLTKNERERDVTKKLYAFFFFNNFLVFTLMSVVWNVVSQIISFTNSDNNHGLSFGQVFKQLEVGEQIATAIINASSFWVMYILKANLGAVLDLLQVFTLLWNSFQKHLLSPTPRQLIQLTAPQNFSYAIYYIWLLFYSTIALSFTSIQPIIMPMLTFYLAFDTILKKYTLMYMFVTKVESDGMFWPLVVNCMLFALAIGNLILLAVVWIQGGFNLAMCVVPLPIIVIAFKIYISIVLNPQFYYFIPTSDERERMEQNFPVGENDTTVISNLEERYRDPVIYRRLLVPMVHAKARHLLPQVCHTLKNDIFEDGYEMTSGFNSNASSPSQEFDIIREDELDYDHYRRYSQERIAGEGPEELANLAHPQDQQILHYPTEFHDNNTELIKNNQTSLELGPHFSYNDSIDGRALSTSDLGQSDHELSAGIIQRGGAINQDQHYQNVQNEEDYDDRGGLLRTNYI